MRFQKSFRRHVGGPSPALGSDGTSTTPPASYSTLLDNFFAAPPSKDGWPAHRIVVSYKGPAAAPVLPAQVWLYDHETEAFYGPGAPVSLVENRLNYFDVIALLDSPQTMAGGGFANPSSGGIELVLVVEDPGGTPAGVYTFAIGADLTTLPI